MLRRMIFATVTIVFVLACCFIAFAKSAEKVNSIVFYEEKNNRLSLYDIDGKRCIAIKDLAVILNNSTGKFDFKFDKDNNRFIIDKGKKYSGELKLLELNDNSPGYDENYMTFNTADKNFGLNIYIINDEYFVDFIRFGKIMDFEVFCNSDSEIYINRKSDKIFDFLKNKKDLKSVGNIFEKEHIDKVREKIKQYFIEAYGEKSFSDTIREKLYSNELCHDFEFLDNELKLKIYTKEIKIPYSLITEYICRDIGNYAVISTYSENKNFDEFFVSAMKIKNYTSKILNENTKAEKTTKKIDKNRPVIALTFDDGPKRKTTERLLDVLEKYDAKATFFVVGNRAEKNKDILKRAYDLGCQIGNHSYSHKKLTKIKLDEAKTEVNKTSNIVFEATGDYTRIGRPPYGALNHEVRAALSLEWFNWSIDTYDWKTRNADYIYKRVIENVGDGDVILMHDLYDTTVSAAEMLIPELAEKGYQFITVNELAELKGGADKISGYVRK